jgi:hypothetical protein
MQACILYGYNDQVGLDLFTLGGPPGRTRGDAPTPRVIARDAPITCRK